MNKIKLILTMVILVIAISIFTAMPAFALTEGDWEFQLLDNEVMITGYLGADKNIVVPDTLYGCPVTAMEMEDDDKNLKDAVSVKFPANLKSVHESIFDAYWGGADSLETVILPEGLEHIDKYAFNECKKLKNINIPSTLKTIGMYAFSESGIESIKLPFGMESIGIQAFYGCESLKTVEIPEGIKKMDVYCFSSTGITELYLPFVEDFTICFSNCKDLKRVTIASGYKVLPGGVYDGAFSGCVSLEEVSIPNTVEEIAYNCFNGCSSLEEVILPTSLKKIKRQAFSGTSIKEIVLPYGVTELGGAVFAKNTALKSVYIPDTINKIDGDFLEDSPNAIVYCASDSYTAKHCKEQKISYLTDSSVNTGIHVLYNGTRISFHSYGQNPELLNSRTLVPLRSIFEAMGAEVKWDNATSTAIAKRDGIEIKIQIGANEMYKDGKAIAVDVPAQLVNSRTMVPVRVIAEAFGADVQWNGNGRVVLITE